jgi:hypothetical protein
MPSWAQSSTLTLWTYMFWLSDRSPRERGTVTLQYVLVISTYFLSLCPFLTWLRLLSPHILYSIYSTLCLFISSLSLCWCFTLVVNPLLTTIAHHIFSSVLDKGDYPHPCRYFCFIILFGGLWLTITFSKVEEDDIDPSLIECDIFWSCNFSHLWISCATRSHNLGNVGKVEYSHHLPESHPTPVESCR